MLIKNPSLEISNDGGGISYTLPFCGRVVSASKKLEQILNYFNEPRPVDYLFEEVFTDREVIDDFLLNSLLVPLGSHSLSRGLLSTTKTKYDWLSSKKLCNKNCVFGVPFSCDPFGYLSAAAGTREVFGFIDVDSFKSSSYLGDILSFSDEGRPSISERTNQLISVLNSLDARPVAIGGDHSISYEIVRTLKKKHTNLHVISFDAHSDDGQLYATPNTRSPLSNANVMSYIAEELGHERVSVIGVRTGRYGLENCTHKAFFEHVKTTLNRFRGLPTYVTIDIDVVDPIYAPDVNYPSPGGISPGDLVSALDSIFSETEVKGCDIVEVCGSNKNFNSTAKIAASTLSWILSRS